MKYLCCLSSFIPHWDCCVHVLDCFLVHFPKETLVIMLEHHVFLVNYFKMKNNKISFSQCVKIFQSSLSYRINFTISPFVMDSITGIHLWSVYDSIILFGWIVLMMPRSLLMSKEKQNYCRQIERKMVILVSYLYAMRKTDPICESWMLTR